MQRALVLSAVLCSALAVACGKDSPSSSGGSASAASSASGAAKAGGDPDGLDPAYVKDMEKSYVAKAKPEDLQSAIEGWARKNRYEASDAKKAGDTINILVKNESSNNLELTAWEIHTLPTRKQAMELGKSRFKTDQVDTIWGGKNVVVLVCTRKTSDGKMGPCFASTVSSIEDAVFNDLPR